MENAYIIPAQPNIDWLRTLTQRGVRVSIVTNSLASHDVPAVNSHYKKWRKPLLQAGVSLYEIRHDAAVQRELADTTPVRSGFMGLHVKAVAVDGERVMIGSMNLDPRSSAINSEMAVLVDSDASEDVGNPGHHLDGSAPLVGSARGPTGLERLTAVWLAH